jgi:hypothetical protein
VHESSRFARVSEKRRTTLVFICECFLGLSCCVIKTHSSSGSKVLPSRSWASVVSAPTALVPATDVVLQSSLAAHIAQLQGSLERVESFLERAEATLSRLSFVPAMLKTSLRRVLLVRLVLAPQRIGE